MDLSGAGDTFLSAFASYIVSTKEIKYQVENAISFAQSCASKVVKKRGVVTI